MKKKEVKPKIALIFVFAALIAVILFILLKGNNDRSIAAQQPQKDAAQMFQFASELYNNGNYMEAIPLYKKIIDIDLQFYSAYINLGHSYLKLGIYNEAIKTFEKTFSLNNHDFRTYYGLGLTYYTMEDYNKAYINLKQAYKLNPKNGAVISYLINTYNAIGLSNEAITLAQSSLLTDQSNSHHYRKMALAYFLKNDLPKALENAQKAVQIDDSYPPNHLTLANAYLGLGDKENSLEEFKTASTLIKSNSVYGGLSATYYLLGDNENSDNSADLANAYPINSFSTSLLGLALLHIGEHDKAIEEFNKAIGNTPNYYLPYKGLGKAYMFLGQKEKAIENFEKAIELNQFDEESDRLLGEILR